MSKNRDIVIPIVIWYYQMIETEYNTKDIKLSFFFLNHLLFIIGVTNYSSVIKKE